MRYCNPSCRLSMLLVFSIVGLAGHEIATAADAAPAMAWHEVPGKYTELRQGDRPIFRYIYRALDESTEQSRFETYKVFHHIFSPSGEQLLTNGPTGEAPYSKEVQFPHHRGLYYGFSRITWGEEKQADTWHCNKGESQQHVEFLAKEVGDNFGRHRLAIDWHDREGEVFLREQREVSATVRPEGTAIDFVSTLESATEGAVHLNGDPQHAGVQFRALDQVAKLTADQTYYLRTDGKGKMGEMRNWNHTDLDDPINAECTNRPWNAMSFVVGDQRYTALYLDHPENPKPARYSERDYGRFGSFFVAEVTQAKPLVVKYRLWIQEGEMTLDTCEAFFKEFSSQEFSRQNAP